jgi:hypothetical protein
MEQNHDHLFKEWVESRSAVNPGDDLADRIMARIERFETKKSAGFIVSREVFDQGLENRFVRYGMAFGLVFLGLFRLAYVSSLFIP